jgi:hypothetical protein
VKVSLASSSAKADDLDAFVDTLPMRGRASLLFLLKAAGFSKDDLDVVESVRRLRNGFAHDITQVNSPLIEIIKARDDKSFLIKSLSFTENMKEADLIAWFESDGSMLRYLMLHGVMKFLILAYHAVTKGGGKPGTPLFELLKQALVTQAGLSHTPARD